METWYDKNVLPSKMIFQLYDPSLVLLKDFFFLSFHLFPLLFNKLNVISDWVYSFLFGCCWISLQRNCTCWSFDQITPALFFRLHFAPLVNSNRARNEREWKIYRPPITSTWFQYKPSQKSHFQHSLWKYCIISPICERIDKILITTNSFTLTKILDESISLELFIWIWS